MNYQIIGARIRKLREEKNWSQEVFAEKANLSLNYIGSIERGEKIPKLETFIRLANLLETSADELLGENLVAACRIRTSKLSERLENLPLSEQKKILDVIEILIHP